MEGVGEGAERRVAGTAALSVSSEVLRPLANVGSIIVNVKNAASVAAWRSSSASVKLGSRKVSGSSGGSSAVTRQPTLVNETVRFAAVVSAMNFCSVAEGGMAPSIVMPSPDSYWNERRNLSEKYASSGSRDSR